MTWGEIKKKIEDSGVTDDMETWYIDISFNDSLSISLQENEGPNKIGFSIYN